MKLIRPLYILPFEYEAEINDYVETSGRKEENGLAFYAPCSSYTLTDMGIEYFGLAKTQDNYFNVAEVIPIERMMGMVLQSNESLQIFAAVVRHLTPRKVGIFDPEPQEIYTFRARLESDQTMWVHLQMPEDSSLHEFYAEIAYYLDLKDNDDYRFYHDKEENRFAEYSSSKRAKRSGKKTEDFQLGRLDFQHQNQMLLVAYNQATPFGEKSPVQRVQIELMHVKPPLIGEEYPRVSRVSKALNEMMD